MLKDYPATQLFLISSVILLAMVLLTPLVREWYICVAILDSLKFIVKVICGLFLLCMVIDVIDAIHYHNHKHSH